MDELVSDLTLKDAARQKYLNYAISVITSRALPDVRDGLKPVQRRILYAMFQDLRLLPDKKELKCAKVVGQVLGDYHPHGDSAVYDALVRMAQEFSLRMPLVDGHGNFGSIDGDSAAAYRYTEAKLQPFAMTLLEEINQDTVDFRDTFDAVRQEPIVLPSQSPMLLVNGATGIAVGIATNIPPHNLGEIIGSCITLINNPDATIVELMKKGQGIQAPDFPTGGLILNTKKELREIYEKGSGPIRMRGEWKLETKGKTPQIVITSIPYMIKKQELAAKIRDLALDKKLPQITDVRDESTTDIRVVLELRADAEPEKVMAYIFKSTPLETNFNINMTCLVPVEGKEVGTPRQLDLKSMLRYFLDFRFKTVKRRFEYELRILRERIHILDGFAKIFNDLDTAIKLIRKSKDKAEASEKLIEHFGLDEIQTNAILEMMLYRIASLEINKILEERKEKRARAKEIEEILSSDRKLWSIIKKELEAIAEKHQTKRRSKIEALDEADVIEVSAEDFIVEEDQFVILTTGGWVKRIGTIKSLDKLQLRQGDEVLSIVAGSTKSCVVFFSSAGIAYTMRIYDLPASRGYGDPIQKLFKFRDGEKVCSMMSLDARVTSNFESTKPDVPPKVHLLAVSNAGFGLRFSLAPFVEPSTRAGRKYARLDENAEIITVQKVSGKESLVVVTKEARALVTKINEINFLEGAGKGVTVIKLVYPDQVLGAAVCVDEKSEGLIAITQQGAEHKINANKYEVVGRGGRGFEVIKRGSITGVKPPAVVLPELPEKG